MPSAPRIYHDHLVLSQVTIQALGDLGSSSPTPSGSWATPEALHISARLPPQNLFVTLFPSLTYLWPDCFCRKALRSYSAPYRPRFGAHSVRCDGTASTPSATTTTDARYTVLGTTEATAFLFLPEVTKGDTHRWIRLCLILMVSHLVAIPWVDRLNIYWSYTSL